MVNFGEFEFVFDWFDGRIFYEYNVIVILMCMMVCECENFG